MTKLQKYFDPKHPAVILFTSKRCSNCTRYTSTFQQMAKRLTHLRMFTFEPETKKELEFARKNMIRTYPTTVFWTGKRLTDVRAESLTEDELCYYLDKNYTTYVPEK